MSGTENRAVSVSVVVPTHNRVGLLERCLQALVAQLQPPAEIIVVDDASSDSTKDLLRAWQQRPLPFRMYCEHLAQNRGPAYARNQGVERARGEWIAFTDDDCEPESGWLKALVNEAQKALPNVAGIGGRVLPTAPGLVAEYMTIHGILDLPPSCKYLVTANCIFRRSVVLAVGGFDATVTKPGGKDPGLSFAVTRAGNALMFCADAVVRHHYRESAIDFLRTFFRYGRGVRLVMDR